MSYSFETVHNRAHTNAAAKDGFRPYLFGDEPDIKVPVDDDDLISMWVADMDFATPPFIVDAMKARLEHPIFGYTMLFEDEYVAAFQRWAKRLYNWEFPSEHLVMSHGVIPTLFALTGFICKEPSDKILTTTPAYGYFKHAADHNGVGLVTSDLLEKDGNFEVDVDDFREKAADPDTKLFFLCHPHNPTGRVWRDDELLEMAQICFDHDVMIVSDEIHCDLLRHGVKHTPLAKLLPNSDKIITCMAPSKTFNLAGMMIANIVIPDPALRQVWKERYSPFQNPLSMTACQAAFSEGFDWLEELKTYLDGNFNFLKSFLDENLPDARFEIPDATYLAWVDLAAYPITANNLTKFFAQKAGVLLEGGEMFIANGGRYVRLNLACPRKKLEKGLIAMTKAIQVETAG